MNNEIDIYLIDVDVYAILIKVSVEGAEHVNHLERSGCATDGREPHDVTEQHRHVVHCHGLHKFTCGNYV